MAKFQAGAFLENAGKEEALYTTSRHAFGFIPTGRLETNGRALTALLGSLQLFYVVQMGFERRQRLCGE